jgi:Integrase zinc binding domain
MAAADALSRFEAGAAPISDYTDVIMSRHIELGHRSWKDTLGSIRTTNSLPKMRQEVWRVVRTCLVGIRYNIVTTKIGNKWQPICTTRPNELLSIDNWGPLSPSYLGYAYCPVGIDNLSKAATVFPTIQMNADVAIHFIQLTICMLGKYDKIMTNSRPYFTSKRFKKWCIDNNVQLHITTPAHSEANGCCERFIRTFQQSLTKMGADSHNWHEFITPTVNGYNSCLYSATGNTPAVCHFSP